MTTAIYRPFLAKAIYLLLLLVFILLSSCLPMATMQTGRTVGKGKLVESVGFGAGHTRHPIYGLHGFFSFDYISLPSGLLSFRYGLSDRFDLGLKFGPGSPWLLESKYQLLGDRTSSFALSAGLTISHIDVSEDDRRTALIDYGLPLCTSWHPSEVFALYLSPKWIYRDRINSSKLYADGFIKHWYGATLGTEFGKRRKFYLEYSHFQPGIGSSRPMYQVLIGCRVINFGKTNRGLFRSK